MARKKTNNKTEEQEEFDVDEPSEVEESNDAEENEGKQTSDSAKGRRSTRPRKPSNKALYKNESSSDIEGLESEGESDEIEEEDSDDFGGGAVKKKRSGGAGGGGGGRGRGRGRGAGAPPAKKKKITKNKKGKDEDGEGNNEEDDDDGEAVDDDEDEEESVDDDEEEEDSETDVADTPPEYRSGCFVVLKADIDNNKDEYPLWKIDGKSLLQKYDRYKNKGKEFFYKSTTIYAGWSKAVVDTYYPIKVECVKIAGQENAVKFDATQIKPKEKETK